METTIIATPVALEGNTYHSVKNNALITVLTVGPTVSNIKVRPEASLKDEYQEIMTKDLVNGILYNKLVFAGKLADQDETEALNKQTVKGNAPYGFLPGHRYVKLGTRNCVVSGEGVKHDENGNLVGTKQDESLAKPSRPSNGVHICTITHKDDKVWNTLVLKSDIEEPTYVTVDSDFVGLNFTATKTGYNMEVIEVNNTYLTCSLTLEDKCFERNFEISDFIAGIEDGRIKPEQAFYDMVEESKKEIRERNAIWEMHLNYFDGSEEPKDFGTNESYLAAGFEWVHPKATAKKTSDKEPKLRSPKEREDYHYWSKKMNQEEFRQWVKTAFND